MRTTADGDSRSRVPSCGRRYADAPTAVPFTARGGGEFPPSYARQWSAVADARRTAAYTPFFLRAPTVAGAELVSPFCGSPGVRVGRVVCRDGLRAGGEASGARRGESKRLNCLVGERERLRPVGRDRRLGRLRCDGRGSSRSRGLIRCTLSSARTYGTKSNLPTLFRYRNAPELPRQANNAPRHVATLSSMEQVHIDCIVVLTVMYAITRTAAASDVARLAVFGDEDSHAVRLQK